MEASGDAPRPPTLEELIKILRVARNFTLSQEFNGDTIHVSFTISKIDCVENDIHVKMFGSQFLGEILAHLDRMNYFDAMTKQFAHQEPGATVKDCISFIMNEIKFITGLKGLEDDLRKRMFNTCVKKLSELEKWRIFVDKREFDKQREWRKKADEEVKRKAEEAERRARDRRKWEDFERKAKEDRDKQDREDYNTRFREEMFRNAYGYTYNYAEFEELFRRAREEMGKEGFSEDFWQGNYGNSRQDGSQRGKARVKPTGNWWEILGVKRDSTRAVIKAAWRKLAKDNHPDRGGSNERMAEINAAKDAGLLAASS